MDPLVLIPMIAAGLATGLGAVPIYLVRDLSPRAHGTIIAFTAGVMLAVVLFDLIPDAVRRLDGDILAMGASIAAGSALLLVLSLLIHRLPLPHDFAPHGTRGAAQVSFVIFVALSIHHAPEGLATGLGYAEGLSPAGHVVALAIALQNMPEGLLVALPILAETGSRRVALRYAFLSGVVEPVAGIAALLFLVITPAALGASFGFAAGAMLAAVLSQAIPESLDHVRPARASLGMAAGLALILAVNVSVGLLGIG